MKKRVRLSSLLPIYIILLCLFLMTAVAGSRAVTAISESAPITGRKCIVIDAGHGGEDGGATSCTGVLESKINLQIALRLEDLLHLLGIDTVMIRKTDISVYTQGETIAARKVSDLKQRVKIINENAASILVSIHQNHFSDSRYRGAQVFYAKTDGSEVLAKQMQTAFIQTLNPESNRQSKKADDIYLMKNINCTGVLIECGFLSNAEEEARLRDEEYQKRICCVISSVCSQFLNTERGTT